MAAKKEAIAILDEKDIAKRIYTIRGQKVMLDRDLAEIYGVLPKRLNEQVKRNKDNFPSDFMFKLNFKEFSDLRSQFATSSWGGQRYLPFVFTHNGISMLSSVLKSKIAIQRNIFIMRTFGKVQQILAESDHVRKQLEILSKNVSGSAKRIDVAFDAIGFLLDREKSRSDEGK